MNANVGRYIWRPVQCWKLLTTTPYESWNYKNRFLNIHHVAIRSKSSLLNAYCQWTFWMITMLPSDVLVHSLKENSPSYSSSSNKDRKRAGIPLNATNHFKPVRQRLGSAALWLLMRFSLCKKKKMVLFGLKGTIGLRMNLIAKNKKRPVEKFLAWTRRLKGLCGDRAPILTCKEKEERVETH